MRGSSRSICSGCRRSGAVERCVETIYKRRGVRVDLSRVPLDDPGVYEELRKGKKKTSFGSRAARRRPTRK